MTGYPCGMCSGITGCDVCWTLDCWLCTLAGRVTLEWPEIRRLELQLYTFMQDLVYVVGQFVPCLLRFNVAACKLHGVEPRCVWLVGFVAFYCISVCILMDGVADLEHSVYP